MPVIRRVPSLLGRSALAAIALGSGPAFAATLTVDPSGGSDYTSLSAAINAASNGDTLSLAGGTYTGPFDTRGKNLTIRGSGVSSTLLTAGSTSTVITVDNGETVTIASLSLYSALQGLEVRGSTATLTGVHITDHSGRSPGSGVGVYDGGHLTVTSCVFARNEASASYDGGGIYASDSTLVVSNSTFRDNAGDQGGAIFLDTSSATLTDVTLDSNIAGSHGGGIRVRYDASLAAVRLTATDNTAGGRGGAIAAYQADVDITDGVFTGNSAATAGGALHLDQTHTTDATVEAEVADNTAGTLGGGIYADTMSLTFTGSITDNAAGEDSDGGGIYAIAADLTIDDTVITGNTAGVGGGIHSFYGGSISLADTTLEDNVALLDGGGIYSESPTSISRASVARNLAGGSGGGLLVSDASLVLHNTPVTDNTASDAGGGVYVNSGDLTVVGTCPITGGTATYGGGIAMVGTGTESLVLPDGQTISDNDASGDGGGLYLTELQVASLDGLHLSHNSAGQAGGGGRLTSIGELSAEGVVVERNTAEHGGGLHLSQVASGATAHGWFATNSASSSGGAILAQNPTGTHRLHHLQVVENTAADGAGIYVFNDSTGGYPLTFSDLAANSGTGVALRQSAGAVVEHTSAAFNAGAGFDADAASAPSVALRWNCAYDNLDDFGGSLPVLDGVDGNLIGDHQYAQVAHDGDASGELLIPGSLSALRDAGDETVADLDGSRADIGHLGGPEALDQDQDADGFALSDGDCDDADPGVYPGATETWYDGRDSDCAGDADDDLDGDGYGIAEDCDDTDPTVNPGARDDTVDGVDNDCDGTDGPGGSADGSDGGDGGEDEDLDGDGYPQSEDCDDSDASASPGHAEACGDQVDNDCDGFVDDFDNDCVGSAGDKSCAVVDVRSHGLGLLAVAAVAIGRRRRD